MSGFWPSATTVVGLVACVAIGGCALPQREQPVAAVPVAAAQASPPAVDGAEVFRNTCVACHGENGRGGNGGGLPLDTVAALGDPAIVESIVRDGRGQMPELSGALTPEQMRAVAVYVINDLFE